MQLDQSLTIFAAFRYALGRQTYIVDSVCNELERLAADIPNDTKILIVREIGEAIGSKRAGAKMDVERWKKCRTALRKTINYKEAKK